MEKIERTKWYGQNCTEKIVWTKCKIGMDKNSADKMVYGKIVLDKMVQTKWYIENNYLINPSLPPGMFFPL